MTSNIHLEAITPGDAPALRQMAESIWWDVYPTILADDQIQYMLNWMYDERQLVYEMGPGGMSYHWILAGDLRSGYAAVEPGPGPAERHLHKFYLDREHRGRGLGSTALQLLLQRAREDAAALVSLRVNRQNASARRCYERNGFAIERTVVTEIGAGYVMDDFWMVCSLNTS